MSYVWRENPDRRGFEHTADFVAVQDEEGVTIGVVEPHLGSAATWAMLSPEEQQAALLYQRTGGAAIPGTSAAMALGQAGAEPKWKAIAKHPATWLAAAVVLGLTVRSLR